MLGLEPSVTLCVRIELAKAGCVAKELFVDRPQAPRANECLVVEAGWSERPGELVDSREEVTVDRAKYVLPGDSGTLLDRCGTEAYIRATIHGSHAVGALARAADEASGSVVLETARKDATPIGIECRAERVAFEPCDRRAVKRERDGLATIYSLVGACAETAHHSLRLGAGRRVSRTRLLFVSRSARNQSSQPNRWYHHSVWIPRTLRLK